MCITEDEFSSLRFMNVDTKSGNFYGYIRDFTFLGPNDGYAIGPYGQLYRTVK